MLFGTSADAFVFWANRDSGTIGRAKTNGKGVDQTYIKARTSVYGVAVDDDHVYWTDRKGGGDRACKPRRERRHAQAR